MLVERTRTGRQMRLYDGGIHTFEVVPLVAELREEAQYLKHGKNGLALVKSPELRVVLITLLAGMSLDEHQEPGPITLQVLNGELRFQAGEEVIYLRQGEILAMPTNCPHSVEAVKDCAFLLTLAPSAEVRESAVGAAE